MRPVDLIGKKRDGGEHTPAEIFWLVEAFTRGDLPDCQMSAWTMAALWRGLSGAETAALTEAMLRSGQVLDLSALPSAKVDKHSTGGVGDKTSLILAPVVAAGGLLVPMITGRGLAHTGGTLDKLEAIPGFNVNLSPEQFRRVLEQCGCAMISQSAEMAPADKKMYALRNLTATVESPSLICASIMSKKLAEGIDALVLDVKTGSGAFMQRQEEAEHLARMMVQTGQRMGKRVVALITDMDQPLGRMVGNSLEVLECVEILRGERRALSRDLRELCVELAAWMFCLGRRAPGLPDGKLLAEEMIDSGKALAKFREMIRLQGGDTAVLDQTPRLASARFKSEFKAAAAGFVVGVQCRQAGLASLLLGGGRIQQDDIIDPLAGLELHKKIGDAVAVGESMATIYYNDPAKLQEACRLLEMAYRIGPAPVTQRPALVKKVING
jgi:pyrimidine-nucleoside phosphorylase